MQARALETKNKILMAALQLYAKKGYYTTTVDQIAAQAQVSTGIAYRYYKNKKEVLLAALNFAFSQIDLQFSEKFGIFSQTKDSPDFSVILEKALDVFVDIHKDYYALHEELEALRHSDKDVKALYDQVEQSSINKIIEILKKDQHEMTALPERVYLMVSLMEDYCHKVTDSSFDFLNQEALKKLTLAQVSAIIDIKKYQEKGKARL